MRYFVSLDGRTFQVDVDGGTVLVDGEALPAEMASVRGTPLHTLLLDGRSHRLLARRRGKGRWDIHMDGRQIQAEVLDRRGKAIREIRRRQAALSGPGPIRAPMPGMVVRVEVEAGDEVSPGDGVVIVEAMKMENELRAESSARVKRVVVAEGEAVEKDQVLVEFEPVGAGMVGEVDEVDEVDEVGEEAAPTGPDGGGEETGG